MVRRTFDLDEFGNRLGVGIAVNIDVRQVAERVCVYDDLERLAGWLQQEVALEDRSRVCHGLTQSGSLGLWRDARSEAIAPAVADVCDRCRRELLCKTLGRRKAGLLNEERFPELKPL